MNVGRVAARLAVGFCGLATLAGAAASAQAGTVTGKVTLIEKGGRTAPDSSEVVVWLEGARGRVKPSRVSMVMKGKEFRPHLVAVGVGSTVEFPNDDPIFHNAFSVSGENKFDLDLYKRPKTGTFTFQHPGVVRVYCNIHPQMSAVVVVRDNPWFARANADGTFALDAVPAGRYVLKAWHERGGEASTELSVPAEGAATTVLTLDGSRFKRAPHKNKFGKDYAAGEPY
jgi:plastocyanin